MVRDPGAAGAVQARSAGPTDLRSAAFMLVVGRDVADPGVQPDGVVFDAHAGELGAQLAGVADVVQVRPLGLEVAEEALDPGLIRRRPGPPEVLRDRAHG